MSINMTVSPKQRSTLETNRMTNGTSCRPLLRGVLRRYHMSRVMAMPQRTSGPKYAPIKDEEQFTSRRRAEKMAPDVLGTATRRRDGAAALLRQLLAINQTRGE